MFDKYQWHDRIIYVEEERLEPIPRRGGQVPDSETTRYPDRSIDLLVGRGSYHDTHPMPPPPYPAGKQIFVDNVGETCFTVGTGATTFSRLGNKDQKHLPPFWIFYICSFHFKSNGRTSRIYSEPLEL
jgi:hypothetical protein